MEKVKVTLAQLTPKACDKEYNLQLITQTIATASQEKAQIVVFPELFLTGYSVENDIKHLAEEKDGESIQKIQQLCKKYGIHTVIGFAEKGEDNQYYIVSALIDDQGELLDIYRKTHLFDDEKKTFSTGNELKVIETAFGKIGLMICFDIEFPEIARTLKLMGAEMLIVINSNMEPYGEYHYIYAKSRAMENEVPLLICNRLGKEGNLSFCGDSMVIDHKGNEILNAKDKELVATVDVSIPNATDYDETSLDYLKNRRPNLYLSH